MAAAAGPAGAESRVLGYSLHRWSSFSSTYLPENSGVGGRRLELLQPSVCAVAPTDPILQWKSSPYGIQLQPGEFL